MRVYKNKLFVAQLVLIMSKLAVIKLQNIGASPAGFAR